jgi:hypothetical protein
VGTGSWEKGTETHRVELRITDAPEGGSYSNRWRAIPTTTGRAGSPVQADTSLYKAEEYPAIRWPAYPIAWKDHAE